MNKALLLGSTFACAAAVAAAQPAAAPTEEAPEKEKQICRTIAESGSRLSRRRICATKAQWDEVDGQNKMALDRIQSGRQTQGN
ncbi:MAG TPA: hypothetical protein VF704_05615 [Allosphingosinicella sp.]|jgi:mevalonate pyrophosphate decarboxylase